ncbi:MAG: aldehyde ferredoxin oxidoreductase family protein [Candidatus Thermoplasmatota archaeon]
MNMDILTIDLSKYETRTEEREDLEKWLGGTGLATQLMRENLSPLDCDPLSEDNVVVLASGPFTSAYPAASKCVSMFKSPLTGDLGESHAGGRSATSISNAGYRAVVIKGKSKKPIYVVIDNDEIHFRDAEALWGIGNSLITGRIIAENEKGRGLRSILRIGGAGENLVSYAGVTTETYRHFGRLGLGAVFGSKNLKALMIKGTNSLKVDDGKSYRDMYDRIYEKAVKSDAMSKYHLLGTAVNVNSLNEIGALPTENLQRTSFENAEELSGEKLAESIGQRIACNHCPIACIHIANLREEYKDEPYFYKTIKISYDYELIFALGSMLGIGSKEDLLKMIHKVEIYGMDAISTGVALAWATEAFQEGLISEEETKVKLEFGDRDAYLKAIDYILEQPTEFYSHLAEGVEKCSDIYGGKDFALAFGKNEMPGYHTGYAAAVGHSIGLRHSHLDNAGYSKDQSIDEYPPPPKLVEELIEEEQERQLLSSLVVCFFGRGVYSSEIISDALEPLGYDLSVEDLKELGREIYFEKLKLKKDLGFKVENLRIPGRILETESSQGKLDEEYIDEAIDHFKQMVQED